MATYKVIQDIEAEDKLFGPLTLRQFIYAAIVLVLGFIAFRFATIKWFLAIPFLPPIGFFALLAAPFGHDQPNEVWLLAKIRFALKPRRRIWDQSGMKELVTVTVPKQLEKHFTKNLSQGEVTSRLQALANTIDSRGWAIKNVSASMYAQPAYLAEPAATDRLLDIATLPQEVPAVDLTGLRDVLDENTNPTAQHLDEMIRATSQARREQLMATIQDPSHAVQPGQASANWFMDKKAAAQPVDEGAVLKQLHDSQNRSHMLTGHMHGIPAPDKHAHHTGKEATKKHLPSPDKTSAPTVDPGILDLANRNDLTVATVARQAQRLQSQNPPDEVVVSLRQ